MTDKLIQIDDFHAVQVLQLEETNQNLDEKFAIGNVAYALDSIEFTVPLREAVVENKVTQFVLLSGEKEFENYYLRNTIQFIL